MPEKIGCDFCWTAADGGWQGMQRKAVADYLASLGDGRLGKELGQMRSWVSSPQLVIEGAVGWTSDGELMSARFGRKVSQREWNGMMLGLGAEGVFVHRTANVDETVKLVVDGFRWWQKTEHGSLHAAMKPAGDWGMATNEDFQRALLAMVPGVGPKRARAVWERFGGVPWRWTCTVEELMEVDGIGKGTAAKMMKVLDQNTPTMNGAK